MHFHANQKFHFANNIFNVNIHIQNLQYYQVVRELLLCDRYSHEGTLLDISHILPVAYVPLKVARQTCPYFSEPFGGCAILTFHGMAFAEQNTFSEHLLMLSHPPGVLWAVTVMASTMVMCIILGAQICYVCTRVCCVVRRVHSAMY